MDYKEVFIVFIAIVIVVLLIYYWPKSKSASAPAPAPAPAPALPAWALPQAEPKKMAAYRSSGFMVPNTYTFTTAGPKYGATMGAIPENLQAVQAAVTNWTGTFQ
jgi:hypothetical protein